MLRRSFLKSTIIAIAVLVTKAFGTFTAQREDFTCNRCGKCCRVIASEDMLTGSSLTWKQKQDLLTERKKHPPAKEGCEMQYFNDEGLATCVIYEMYGSEKRDRNCVNYPGPNQCIDEDVKSGKREDIFPYKEK